MTDKKNYSNKSQQNDDDAKQLLPQRIYPELNLEKWSIWQPANSRNQLKEIIIEREITLADGTKVTARVEVGSTNKGVLTTEDQKVFYAIIKMWQEDRYPELLYFSLRRLAKVLKRLWGKDTAKSLSQSLRRLHDTPLAWLDSYYDSVEKATYRRLKAFRILDDLEIAEKEQDKHNTKQACYCKLHSLIAANIKNGYTKPLLYESAISFKNNVAQMLYHHLDLVMADKQHYFRRTKDLCDDLQLKGEAYKNLSDRKRSLERALLELQEVALSTGIITSAKLEKTTDGKDYKMLVSKGKFPSTGSSNTKTKAIPAKETTSQVPDLAKDQATLSAIDLVKHFYQIFRPSVAAPCPTPKEVGQAAVLITKYGLEQAKFIVDFSHKEAPKTNYSPQAFGGIVQYAERAIAQCQLKEKQQQQREAQTQIACDQEEQACIELEALVRKLIPDADQYQDIYERFKSRALRELPHLQNLQHGTMFRGELAAMILHELKEKEKAKQQQAEKIQ